MKKMILAFIVCVGLSFAFTACGQEEPVNQFVGEWEPVTVIEVMGDGYFVERREADVTAMYLGELGSAYGPVTISNDGDVSIEMGNGDTLSYQWKELDNGEDEGEDNWEKNWIDLEGVESDSPLSRENINYDPEKDQIILVFSGTVAGSSHEVSYSRK